ncbi:MAG: immunoglobulin domain-containing protein [Clostridia bacterium]|nr:immunoglobulin domain-containing protein [Clostridia bacterium]
MKKLTALLLVLLMTLTAAFATAECPCEGGYDLSTREGDPNSKYSYLSSDFSIYLPFRFNRGESHFCLHGNEFSLLNGQTSCFVRTGDDLYLYDCQGYGEMHNGVETFEFALLRIWEGAKVTIDGGFYTANGSSNGAIALDNQGTVTVYDAVITGNPVLVGNDIIVGEGSVLIEKTDTRIVVAKHPRILYPTAAETLTAPEGVTVTLKTEVKDWRPLTYQWYCDGKAIAGATNAVYEFPAAMANDGSEYHCVVTNDVELSATSMVYTLKVIPTSGSVPAIPETGDDASLILWTGMLLLTGAAFICLRRKSAR